MTDEMVQIRLKVYSQPGMTHTMVKVMKTVMQMNREAFGDINYYDHTLAHITCPTLVIWTDHNPEKASKQSNPPSTPSPQPKSTSSKRRTLAPMEKPDQVNQK